MSAEEIRQMLIGKITTPPDMELDDNIDISPDPEAFLKIKEFLSRKSGIPEEQFECEFLADKRLEKYLVVFPHPLDFYLILYVCDGKFATFSINGDENIDSYIERDTQIHDLLEAYGKAYKLSTILNAANDKIKSLEERVKELEYLPMPGPESF